MGQDLRNAVRSFIRAPLVSLVAVTILALGVGLNAAVFAFVNAAMIRPFPYPDAERLVAVFEIKGGRTTSLGWPLTPANLSDVRAETGSRWCTCCRFV